MYLSEVFPLTYLNSSLAAFRLSPEVERKVGNSFSWYLSKQFPGIVVIWEKGYFWILAQPNFKIPDKDVWKKALEEIQEKLRDKVGNRAYFIQWVNEPKVTASIISQLAVRILKIHCRFASEIVFDENQVQVKRECGFWAETYEVNNEIKAAIALSPKSDFLYKENLEHFFCSHPERNDPENLLIDLLVRDIDNNSTATIIGIHGTVGEHRDKLLKEATGSTSKEQLQIAPDNQPVVSVRFGRNSNIFDYAMAALRPCVTAKTASRFNAEYGTLLKHTKIKYQERQQLLLKYKQDADNVLRNYGFNLVERCINSRELRNLFWVPKTKLEDTLLLFGNGVTSPKKHSLRGLAKGGVYHRHLEFQDLTRKIRLAILNFSSLKVQRFFETLRRQLETYKFPLLLPRENIKTASLEKLSETEAKAKVQSLVDEVVQIYPDLVLVFLPESDRTQDDSDGESVYAWVYRRLLRRRIASQVIYEKTLHEQSKYVFDQVVPGTLAKLGNLPFVLAEPSKIADYFIGLDVARRTKKNITGSINACASVRVYGSRGQFIQYQLADDSASEGEEIPKIILQEFLSLAELRNKRILIYRDGGFRGDEVKNISAWGEALNSKFILVECAKSQIPRLYNLANKSLLAPTRGLALRLSSREAVLVTTQVKESVGVPRPLRLKIREEGASVDLPSLVDTTLKLTLLHHGSLKDPRLPVPLFGADRIAYRRLQGIYPGELEGDKQYWL